MWTTVSYWPHFFFNFKTKSSTPWNHVFLAAILCFALPATPPRTPLLGFGSTSATATARQLLHLLTLDSSPDSSFHFAFPIVWWLSFHLDGPLASATLQTKLLSLTSQPRPLPKPVQGLQGCCFSHRHHFSEPEPGQMHMFLGYFVSSCPSSKSLGTFPTSCVDPGATHFW